MSKIAWLPRLLRSYSQEAGSLFSPRTASSAQMLDLDFVLGLLDAEGREGSSIAGGGDNAAEGPSLATWSHIKFRAVDADDLFGLKQPETVSVQKNSDAAVPARTTKRGQQSLPIDTVTDPLERLQSLANAMSRTPMEPRIRVDAHAETLASEPVAYVLPMLQRPDTDWHANSITRILSKLAMPGVLESLQLRSKTRSQTSSSPEPQPQTQTQTQSTKTTESGGRFLFLNLREIRMVEASQLRLLAETMLPPEKDVSAMTALQMERTIYDYISEVAVDRPEAFVNQSELPAEKTVRTLTRSQGLSAQDFVWTEERETRLMALHGELSAMKRSLDAKITAFLSGRLSARILRTSSSLDGDTSRGLWPLVASELARHCGVKVTASACRKKWTILVRLRSTDRAVAGRGK